MRLVQVAASIAPRDGGPATGILGLNRALNSIGIDALILSTDADGPTERVSPSAIQAATSGGSRATVFKRSRPLRLKNSWSQAHSIWRHAAQADVVHINGVYLAHSVWAYLAARRYGKPHTIQPHGSLEPYQRQFGRLHKGVWDRLIGGRILRNAAALVAASESEARNLRELVPGASVIVMPLGVTTVEPEINTSREAEFDRWLSVPRHQRVLFLGRLAAKKRPDVMISAWQKTTHPSQLAVVGPEQDWTHADLEAMVSPARRADLTVARALNPPGVAWLMRQAGIFVLPSENENFGIAVAEAMLHGCAVITTAETAAGEHVRAAHAGTILPAGDNDALTLTLDEYLGDEGLTTASGKRGSGYATENLTWHAAAKILEAAYLTVIAQKEPCSSTS